MQSLLLKIALEPEDELETTGRECNDSSAATERHRSPRAEDAKVVHKVRFWWVEHSHVHQRKLTCLLFTCTDLY